MAVVDDEERIRMGLAKLIRRAGEDYQVCGTFASGTELLDSLSLLHVDLVITDIKMPVMDGLELAEELRKRRPEVQVAILSGFDDFNFARQALRSGVVEYLLKPVEQEDLYALLHKVRLQQQQESSSAAGRLEEHISLLLGKDSALLTDRLREEICTELKRTPLFRDYYAVMQLHSEPRTDRSALESMLAHWQREWMITAWSGSRLVLTLALGPGDHADTLRELGMSLLRRLPHASRARVGASGVFQGPERLQEAAQQAGLALSHAWYAPGSRVLQAFDQLQQAAEETPAHPIVLLGQEFRTGLEVMDLSRAEEALRAWLASLPRYAYSWAALTEGCTAVLKLIRSAGHPPGTAAPGSEPQQEDLLAPHLFGEWALFAAAFMGQVSVELLKLREARQQNRVVETVQAYIQERFTEEVELGTLAKQVFLTPSYLSKLFKTETGETITDYIISLRIGRARELLRTELGLKTYEVGERVGYTDPVYFNKVFKKTVGCTPKEYRERVR